MGLPRIKTSCKGLQGVLRGYKGLQEVKRGLQVVTRDYRG